MRDRFNNAVDIEYTYTAPIGDQPVTKWTLTDTTGERVHYVHFVNFPSMNETFSKGQQVSSIDFEGFNGARVVIPFTYTPSTGQGQYANLPQLTKIALPDGTTYDFTYRAPGSGASYSLATVRFPTGGKVTYNYVGYDLPVIGNPCGEPTGVDTYGIASRTVQDGASTRVWDYVQRRGPKVPVDYHEDDPCDDNGTPPQHGPAYWTRTSVLAPADANGKRTRSDHYFNVFRGLGIDDVVLNPFPGFNRDIPVGQPITMGRPDDETATGAILSSPYNDPNYPADISAHDGQRLFSTQIFSGCANDGNCTDGTLLRTTHVRLQFQNVTGAWIQDSIRTRFEDDWRCAGQICYTQTDLAEPTLFGAFRRTTTSSNIPSTPTAESFITYPEWEWSSASIYNAQNPWLLTTFSEKKRTIGGVTSREQFCFDATTGFLKRHRILAGTATGALDGVTPGSNDILNVFVPNAKGEVEEALSYGADKQAVATGADLCAISLPTNFWFKSVNTYTAGVLMASRPYDRATQDEMVFDTVSRDVDPSSGRVKASRDSADLETTYSYDSMARLGSVTLPSGSSTAYTYTNAVGTAGGSLVRARVDVVTTSTGGGTPKSRVIFDGLGRVSVEAKLGPAGTWIGTETFFDEQGRKAWVSQPESVGASAPTASLTATHKTRFEYDAFGRQTKVTQPDGTASAVAYVGISEQAHTMTVSGFPASRYESYDGHGRLLQVEESGLTAAYGYDVGDRLSSVAMADGNERQARTFVYDRRGFLLSETHPELGASGYGTTHYSDYDPKGNAGRKVTGVFDVTTAFDSLSRVTEVYDDAANRTLKSFVYDRWQESVHCKFGPKCDGKLAAAARYNYDPDLGTVLVTESYQYDGLGGQASRRDRLIAATAVLPEESFFTSATYNDLGGVKSIIYPCRAGDDCAGRPTVEYTYANGVLTGVTGWSTISYHPNGTLASVSHAGGVTEEWTADPNGMARPRAIAAKKDGAALWSTGDYLYDGAGNIVRIGSTDYRYDPFGRLISWTQNGAGSGYSSTGRGYDTFGNYLYSSISGCGPLPPAGQPRPCFSTSVHGRQITSAFYQGLQQSTNRYTGITYDAAGNVTNDGRSFSYDPAGMTTKAVINGRDYRYLYSADDERIGVVERVAINDFITRNRATWTIRGFDNQVLSVWKDDSTSGTRVVSWANDEIFRNGNLLGELTTAGRRHFSVDHLGSPRAITLDNGTLLGQQEFGPFGGGGASDGGPLQFTGHERDAALYGNGDSSIPDNMHARLADVGEGRFLVFDQGDSASRRRLQSWNKYSYVENNPLKLVDEDGKIAKEAIGAVAGAFVGVWVESIQQIRSGRPVNNRRLLGAILGGAVGGALATSCGKCGLGAYTIVQGGVAGAASGIVQRGVNGEKAFDVNQIQNNVIGGMAGQALGAAAGKGLSALTARTVEGQTWTAIATRTQAMDDGLGIVTATKMAAPIYSGADQVRYGLLGVSEMLGNLGAAKADEELKKLPPARPRRTED
jgi:RHS repeat-associated protein